MKVILVCGIDTDVGKTYVAGSYLGQLLCANKRAASYKPVQTGSNKYSIDLAQQLEIATEYCHKYNNPKALYNYLGNERMVSYLFKEPVSPHLAANLEQQYVSMEKILQDLHVYITNLYPQLHTKNLLTQEYVNLDVLLIELAGGIFSPINDLYTNYELINEIKVYCDQHAINLEIVLVSNAKLGSISQTLSSIKLLPQIDYLIYNTYLSNKNQLSKTDKLICDENLKYYRNLQSNLQYYKLIAENPLTLTELRQFKQDGLIVRAYTKQKDYTYLDSYNKVISLQDTSLLTLKIIEFHDMFSNLLNLD